MMANRVPIVRARSKRDLEWAAQQVLMQVDPVRLKCPGAVNVERLFEIELPKMLNNLQVHVDHLPTGIEGETSLTLDGACICTVSLELWEEAQVKTPARRRRNSTTAHEIGHVLLHAPQFRAQRCEYVSAQGGAQNLTLHRRQDIKPFLDPEWQAHRFAGYLLVPRGPAMQMLADGADVFDLANAFDVNPKFVEVHLKALGVLR